MSASRSSIATAMRSRGSARGAGLFLLLMVGGCSPGGGAGKWVRVNLTGDGAADPQNVRLMKAETSAIAGAQARVVGVAPASGGSVAAVGACVTDAGYCPLAARTQPGLNCLCQTGDLAYGGLTGAAPQTYEP